MRRFMNRYGLFPTYEEVKVSSELRNKRWNTEITARDALYLEKLGMSTH